MRFFRHGAGLHHHGAVMHNIGLFLRVFGIVLLMALLLVLMLELFGTLNAKAENLRAKTRGRQVFYYLIAIGAAAGLLLWLLFGLHGSR